MNSTALISAGVVGMFFTCCGWNKLFDDRRSASMRATMRKYLPGDHFKWWLFVSSSELLLGLALIVATFGILWQPHVIETIYLWKAAGAGLFVVCAVAFGLVGQHQVMKDWAPATCSDFISCLLYKTEVLLMVLCSLVVLA